MEFFFTLFIIGIVMILVARFSQLARKQATIHCLKHKWKIDAKTREMYCEDCKARPE